MGQISINLTDNDKLTLKKEAKKQKKSLSEFCRERILNPHKQIPSEKSTDFLDISPAVFSQISSSDHGRRKAYITTKWHILPPITKR